MVGAAQCQKRAFAGAHNSRRDTDRQRHIDAADNVAVGYEMRVHLPPDLGRINLFCRKRGESCEI